MKRYFLTAALSELHYFEDLGDLTNNMGTLPAVSAIPNVNAIVRPRH